MRIMNAAYAPDQTKIEWISQTWISSRVRFGAVKIISGFNVVVVVNMCTVIAVL